MITNEQIAKLRTMAGFDDVLLADELPALRAAIDTLEKLPATRDGVRVVPHVDKVWHPNLAGTRGGECWIANILTASYYPHSRPQGPADQIYIQHCYSTRTAAERAAKEAMP